MAIQRHHDSRMESPDNSRLESGQEDLVREQVKRLTEILHAKGYDGEFTAYWSGKGNSKGDLSDLLLTMADGSGTALQVMLYPKEPLVSGEEPCHYYFDLEYSRGKGFRVTNMFLEKNAKVFHHFYGKTDADFPSKEDLLNLIVVLNNKKQLSVTDDKKWKRRR